jgi:hypothetical protein
MTAQSLSQSPRGRTSVGVRGARNVLAVLAGLLTTALLSLVVDEILHRARVFPPWGQPYFGTGPYVVAVAYRSIFNVVGFLVTARLAPRNPGRHVAVLAAIGFTVGLLSIIPTVSAKLGPVWYPVALALLTVPCASVAVAILRVRARRSPPPSPAV